MDIYKEEADRWTGLVVIQPTYSGNIYRRQTDIQEKCLRKWSSTKITSPYSVKCFDYSTNTCISPRHLPLTPTLVSSAD
jgi:hypothetical protein